MSVSLPDSRTSPLYEQEPFDLPEVLYKYRPFDDEGRLLKLITEGELWFASPRDFNDPFDMAIAYSFDADFKTLKRWCMMMIKREHPSANREQRRRLVEAALERHWRRSPGIHAQMKQKHLETVGNSFGVCCMAAPYDEVLMWSHYARNHEGVCVGIGREQIVHALTAWAAVGGEKMLAPLPVRYVSEMPVVPFYEHSLNRERTSALDGFDLLRTKSKHWAYEQEVRLMMFGDTRRAVRMGPEAVREVRLGCRSVPANRRSVLDALDRVGSSAAVYVAKKHERRFALDFERIR